MTIPPSAAIANDRTTTKSTVDNDNEVNRLLYSQRYFYQNRQTGQASAIPLTTLQLCRMLCPPSCAEETASTSQQNQIVTADTQLLAVLSNENDRCNSRSAAYSNYSSAGWKPAKSFPVLAEVISQWYYESSSGLPSASSSVEGPVSCRSLAKLYHNGHQNNDGNKDQQQVTDRTRVYSANATTTANEWKPIGQLPHLQTALRAFADTKTLSSSIAPTHTLATEECYEAESIGNKDSGIENDPTREVVQDELKAFLASTDHLGGSADDDENNDDVGEAYESDGGTQYVKDPATKQWIHEALMPKSRTKTNTKTKTATATSKTAGVIAGASSKKRKKKAKFATRNARCWVYATGLPPDTSEEEVAAVFGKVGILDLDPETQRPKIKLYKDTTNNNEGKNGSGDRQCKGDASICYARPESVELALTLLDESPFRPNAIVNYDGNNWNNRNNKMERFLLHVERAKFEQHGTKFVNDRKNLVSNAKRKVAKLAAIQAVDWGAGGEEEDGGGDFNGRLTGGRKGLRIIVLKHLFDPRTMASEKEEDTHLEELSEKLRSKCEEEFGVVEKITAFSKNPDGVVIVKFALPSAASKAVKQLDGTHWEENRTNLRREEKIKASFWDGVTDYTIRDEVQEAKETEKRHEEFGQWLESQQELPEELRLQTE